MTPLFDPWPIQRRAAELLGQPHEHFRDRGCYVAAVWPDALVGKSEGRE